METKVRVGDIFLVTDLSNLKFTGWHGDGIKFKTKTVKPVIYLVLPRSGYYLELYPLNPSSQFKNASHTPDTVIIWENVEEGWKKVWSSLKYLGHIDDKRLEDDNRCGNYLQNNRQELYKEWSAVAKEKGFEEKPVEDWKPKGQHLDTALDFVGQEVHVGDTVAYVDLGYGQKFQTSLVQSITEDNFVLESLCRNGKQSRPHNYVIKVDPNKIEKCEN